MSIDLMAWVWRSGPENQAQMLVLLALADAANERGYCWPAVATIARKARMSERNARRILRDLEDAGWIAVNYERGRNHTNGYTITKPDNVSARTECPPGQIEQENRTNRAGKPDTAMSAEPSRTIKNHHRDSTREILLSVLSPETADAFIEHRRAKRAKLTDQAATLIAKKLAGHPNPDAVVEESIANGWTGVFPHQEKAHAPSKPRSASAARVARVAARFERGDTDVGGG